jgi:hypothetical protein
MASFLPFRPCFRGPWGLRFCEVPRPNQGTEFSSLVLHRHPGVLPSDRPSRYPWNARKHPAFTEHLVEAFLLFSISRKQSRFCSPRRSARRPEIVALTSGSSALRVWLPSQRLSLSFPQELLSAPDAPELYPSELFSSRAIEGRLPFPFSAPALFHKPRKGFVPALQRLDPAREAVPLIAARVFTSGRGHLLSWVSPPFGLSLRGPSPESFSLPGSPLSFFRARRPRDLRDEEPQGFSVPGPASPSEKGTGPFDVSDRPSSPTSSGK